MPWPRRGESASSIRTSRIERQAEEVEKVKRSANGIILNPATLPPDATLARAREIMDQYNVSGLPITRPDGHLVGILTRRDMRFQEDWDVPIAGVMTRDPGHCHGDCNA